jgi:tripartite-type tricarboxylate transporter receptor subunit TctC
MTKEQPMHRRTLLAAAVPFALAAPAARAQQRFPNRPVTVIVPFTAGGPTDVITRIVAEGMSRDLGQPVVVENVTGAGGTIAAARVAQARPDGHTLLMHHIGHASSATLYRRLPYDVQDSFAPLGLVSDAAMTLVARPDFPAADLAGYMAEIRRQGDRLNLAHSGLGGANHLCGMLLQHTAGTALTGVVFRGSAPAITDLMAGRIDVFCDQATNTAPFLRDNRIKGYAVTLPERVPGLELPTTAEAGEPSLLMSTWHGLYAPRATPAEVQERLSAAIRAALREERLRQRFAELVTAPATEERATPAFHRRFLAEEIARWRPIIQAAGQYAD